MLRKSFFLKITPYLFAFNTNICFTSTTTLFKSTETQIKLQNQINFYFISRFSSIFKISNSKFQDKHVIKSFYSFLIENT
jgi:hypothetical protein